MANVKRPTLDQLKDIVASLHMSMSDREVNEYLDVMEGTFQAYDRVAQLPDYFPPVAFSTHAGLSSWPTRKIRSMLGPSKPKCAARPTVR